MNTTNEEVEQLQKNILVRIEELIVAISRESYNTISYRSIFLEILAEEKKILSQETLELDKLKQDNFGISDL